MSMMGGPGRGAVTKVMTKMTGVVSLDVDGTNPPGSNGG